MITKAAFYFHLNIIGFKDYEEYEQYVKKIDFPRFRLTGNDKYVDFYSDERYLKLMNVLYNCKNNIEIMDRYMNIKNTNQNVKPIEYLKAIDPTCDITKLTTEIFEAQKNSTNNINFVEFVKANVESYEFGWETDLSEYKKVFYDRFECAINNIKKITELNKN